LCCLTFWWLDQSSEVITCIKKEKYVTFRTVASSLEVLKCVLKHVKKNACVTCFQRKFY
jgi:hypothetical protein